MTINWDLRVLGGATQCSLRWYCTAVEYTLITQRFLLLIPVYKARTPLPRQSHCIFSNSKHLAFRLLSRTVRFCQTDSGNCQLFLATGTMSATGTHFEDLRATVSPVFQSQNTPFPQIGQYHRADLIMLSAAHKSYVLSHPEADLSSDLLFPSVLYPWKPPLDVLFRVENTPHLMFSRCIAVHTESNEFLGGHVGYSHKKAFTCCSRIKTESSAFSISSASKGNLCYGLYLCESRVSGISHRWIQRPSFRWNSLSCYTP